MNKIKTKIWVLCGSCDHVKGVVSDDLHLLLVCCNSMCVLHPSDLPPRPELVGVLWVSGLPSLFFVVAV